MSKTDKTRPYRVKMFESAANYEAVHNHASRPKRDKNGNYVYRLIGGFWPGGEPKREQVYEDFDGNCDLPASPNVHIPEDWHGCHYTAKRGWEFSGEARCGCPRCTDQFERKAKAKRERRKTRIAARLEVRDVLTPEPDECGCKCHAENDAEQVPFCIGCDNDYSNLCSNKLVPTAG